MTTDYSQVIAETREDMLRIRKEGDIPGLAIALVDGQETIWAEGFGHTDRSQRVPVTSRTRFSTQSISKTYTAIGFLVAVEKGLVALDDPLVKFYPEFTVNSRWGPEDAGRITFRQLLSHWAGFPHEAPVGSNFDYRPHRFEEHIRSISDTWLLFRPGERSRYSNLGIDLASYVLQRISGKPFERHMADELLSPLGMQDSTFWQTEQCEDPTVARGHTGASEWTVRAIPMLAPGGLFSTVEDMARFISFNLSGGTADGRRVLREETLRAAYRPQYPVPGQTGGYGLCVHSVPFLGATRVGHQGGGWGYLTTQEWIPEYGIGVAVLTNQDAHQDLHQAVAETALKRMIQAKLGRVPEPTTYPLGVGPEIAVGEEELKRVEGTYATRHVRVAFGVQGGRLQVSGFMTDAGFLQAEDLHAHGDAVFTGAERKFTFFFGPDGRPHSVKMYWPAGVETMPVNDTPLDPPGLDRPHWTAYVGTYDRVTSHWGPHAFAVSVRNGYLYAGDEKLREFRAGLFFTADGESVEFKSDGLVYGNVWYGKRASE